MYPERVIFFSALIFALLVLFNLIYLDYKINHLPTQTTVSLPTFSPKEIPATSSAVLESSGCNLDCQTVFQEYIDKKVSSAKSDILKIVNPTTAPLLSLPNISPTPSPTLLLTLQPTDYYLDLGGSYSAQSNDWTDAQGFQIKFNAANYPGAKGFYFQANLRTDAPDRSVAVRLYDGSANTAIANSELDYTGQPPVFKESLSLSLPSSDSIIKLQIHGTNDNRAYVDNPKIRIAY